MFVVLAILVLGVAIILMLTGIYQKNTNAFCKSTKSLHGKTAIVTGGTAGMGLEIAKDFARRGGRVIIVCPYEKEGEEAKDFIIKKTGNKNVVYQFLDLASLSSVREFASNILKTEDRLDILVNNAGVGMVGDFLSKDGLNFAMQVNYFGHFLLSVLLLPLLKKSAPSRVINTASLLHMIGKVNINKFSTTGQFFLFPSLLIYSVSKWCTIPFSREFTRRAKGSGVVMNVVDPGLVGTGIFLYSMGRILGSITILFAKYLYKSPREGAQTAIFASVDESAEEVSGEMFKNCRLSRGVSSAYDDELAKQLWDETVKLVKLTEKEMEASFGPFNNNK